MKIRRICSVNTRSTKDIVKVRTFFFVALFLAAVSIAAFGQTHKASIRGRLTDGSQLRLAGVPIALVRNDTNERRTTTTNDEGDFVIPSLPPGAYRLEIQRTGYKKYLQQLTLEVNQEIRLDISLEVGSIAEELIVTAPETPLRKD